jgi:predicted Zn-dependent protease
MAEEPRSLTGLLAATLSALLLAGCPAPAPRPDAAGQALSTPETPLPQAPAAASALPPAAPAPRPPRENRLSPATRSLVAQARTQAARGDADGASASLDRALRIEPNNPLLWIERGKLRLTDNDAHQAEVCGRKALVLASGDRATQKQAGSLLIDALRAQARNQEAHDVETQSFMR